MLLDRQRSPKMMRKFLLKREIGNQGGTQGVRQRLRLDAGLPCFVVDREALRMIFLL
jgi:hypothetical protein